MNKRLFLNVMIVALLTFYMIFNIVYQQLLNKHEPEQEPEIITDVWASSFMVPENWHLVRLEMPNMTILVDSKGKWSEKSGNKDSTIAASIALSWQNFAAPETQNYQQLPLEGQNVLAFVAEDSQPLIFRVVEQDNKLHFFRMIDQKQFSFPSSSKSQLLPE